MTDDAINIRTIQHYMYCSHRWGLIEIDCSWAENYFVCKANILHERVHSGEDYHIRNRKIRSNVTVWNDSLGLYGVTDCVEENNGKYSVIEYKPTTPKGKEYNEEDAMQVFAQKVCFDNIFNCNCAAYIYYADKHKKVKLPFADKYYKYYDKLNKILSEMRFYKSHNIIPTIKEDVVCTGCSMKDLCMPTVRKHKILTQLQLIKLVDDI